MGGGYLFKITGEYLTIQKNLSILESLDWIDSQTAAVFVEFTLFNPNVNLYEYCSILFEILPTGTLLKSAQFNSLDVFDVSNSGLLSFKILMNIIYIIFIGIFMAVEIRQFMKMGKRYFLQFYNYIELLIIGFSWAAFSMYMYRLYSSYDIYKSISKLQSGNNHLHDIYLNLQYISNCDILLNYFIGFCAAFGSLRFIKLLRFNKRIIVFLEAFRTSLVELASFGVVFLVTWMAFVQVFYILLNDQFVEFATIQNSMALCFQMILGRIPALIITSNVWLASVAYILFVIFIIFVMINIFITILNDSYALACENEDLDKEDPELFNYLKSVLSSVVCCGKNSVDTAAPEYRDYWDSLPGKFDHYLTRYDKVICFFDI